MRINQNSRSIAILGFTVIRFTTFKSNSKLKLILTHKLLLTVITIIKINKLIIKKESKERTSTIYKRSHRLIFLKDNF